MKKLFIVLIMGSFIFSCATTSSQQRSPDFKRDVVVLKQKLDANPGDAFILRDIGVLCYENNYNAPALKYLMKAFKANLNDVKTNAYLGLALEGAHKESLALLIYKRYPKFSLGSMFRDIMEGRYFLLMKNRIRSDVKTRITDSAVQNSKVLPNAIAVFPLEYKGKSREYDSMGRGLSEMIITDMSYVPELQLVERVRVQSLKDEMELANSGMVEQSTAPQFGKLLNAGKMIHGSFNVRNGRELQIDVALWDVLNQRFPEFDNRKDALGNFFKIEKEIVFGVIEDLGIELTQVQREKIMRIPTKNLNAFLAYCKGLEKEDSGDYRAASGFFQKATKMDPAFSLADARARTSSAVQVSSRPSDLRLAAGNGASGPQGGPPPAFQQGIVRDRFKNMSMNIRSNFIPGQDSRKSAEEVQKAGSEVFQELPLPPLPPPR